MVDRVRVGMIGSSWWADGLHLPSLQSHPQAEIAAICGRSRDRAEEMAKKYAIPQVFTDYRQMIEQAKLDAVVIATPDDQHFPMAMAALDAGLHVLCEKPLAMTASQARAMYEQAEATGVKHMTFFTWRFIPCAQYVASLVEAGYLGRLYHADFRYLAGYGRSPKYGWRFDRQRSNGILGDLGSHIIDLARLFAGEIRRVSAHLITAVDRPGPDGQALQPANEAALLGLEFDGGGAATIQVSALAHVADRQIQHHIGLYGEAGTLEMDGCFAGESNGITIRGARHDEDRFRLLPVPDEFWGAVDSTLPFLDQLDEVFVKQPAGPRLFIDAILADRPITPSFYDGWKVQEVIDAALVSDQTGAWVAIAEANPLGLAPG